MERRLCWTMERGMSSLESTRRRPSNHRADCGGWGEDGREGEEGREGEKWKGGREGGEGREGRGSNYTGNDNYGTSKVQV